MYREILTIIAIAVILPPINNLIDSLIKMKTCLPCLTFWTTLFISIIFFKFGLLNNWQSIFITTGISWIISIKTQTI